MSAPLLNPKGRRVFYYLGLQDRHAGQCGRCQTKTKEGMLHWCAPNRVPFLLRLQAFCEPGKVDGNGILAFARYVLFPILSGEGNFRMS